MRFARLEVSGFQGVERADLAFGPGLNVLYGPNDLGKSTMGTAIRAALLVPPTSAEATRFSPWHVHETPRVTLTFIDGQGAHWQVMKEFGDERKAEFRHSKDGVTFTLDCKGRQVEDRIRGQLGWGIPAPGGKGGPRGAPESFLANALLAAQADVDGILGRSLADDLDESGKLRLTRALATLAQDPALKRVLEAAQREVDLCFTPTGQRRRGQSSRFGEASRVVQKLEDDLQTMKRQLDESAATEEHVNAFRERRSQAEGRMGQLTQKLTALRRRAGNTVERQAARGRLDEARAALGKLDALAGRVAALDVEARALAEAEKAGDGKLALARTRVVAAERALRGAEEAHTKLTRQDGARELELRRAQLAEQVAALETRRQAAGAEKTRLEEALARRAAATAARRSAEAAVQDATRAGNELGAARAGASAAATEMELARAVLAYGRWRAAAAAASDAAAGREAAARARMQAAAQESDAAALQGRATTLEQEVARRLETLPSADELAALERLEREVAMADAALGGGLSVEIRPSGPLAYRAEVDGGPAGAKNGAAVIEAQRSVRLIVEGLGEIAVTAGAADRRRQVEALRQRWSDEGAPVLSRAGLPSLKEVARALTDATNDRAAVTGLRKDVERLRAAARALGDQATLQETQATRMAGHAGEVDARKAAIGASDPRELEKRFGALGKTWEPAAQAAHDTRARELQAAQEKLGTAVRAAELADYRRGEAGQRADEMQAALSADDPQAQLPAVIALLATIERELGERRTQLGAVGAQTGEQVRKAKQAVEAAAKALESARQESQRADESLAAARALLHAKAGERQALATQLASLDRPGAEGLVKQRQAELGALPDEPDASAADVAAGEAALQASQAELEQAREALHKSEGALSKVGGTAVREHVQRLGEAVDAARTRQLDLEIDAESWKLLHETLRQVEDEESAHLGRALAGPVGARFGELTAGRYANLRLDAGLKTEALDFGASAAEDVVGALSLGTRDQLATLIRLTIADQLKSAIVLDDHLVHTDPERLTWFREVLFATALNTQVIVFTCRPEDYLARDQLPDGTPVRDLAGGSIRAVDLARVISRWSV